MQRSSSRGSGLAAALWLLGVAACSGVSSVEIPDPVANDAGGGDLGQPADAALPTDSSAPAQDSGRPLPSGDAAADAAADAAPDGGGVRACNVNNPGSCGPNAFCDSNNCGAGTCRRRPAEDPDAKPACGCDGVTYWNESVANARGVAVRSKGECSPGVTCGGIAAQPCPANTVCNYQAANDQVCRPLSDRSGVCWGLPATCATNEAAGFRACGERTCQSRCAQIRRGVPFYVDETCPPP